MKFNRKLMVLAAAGALTAATATSALAFENEFHGFYNIKYFLSNYETSSFGFLRPDGQSRVSVTRTTNAGVVTPGVLAALPTPGPENQKGNNFFDSRARIFYTAKASDDLKLVTGFEIDSVFGDKAQGQASRNNGGALESDATNLETKWVYLDFKIPTTPVKVTAGIQPAKDAFKGIFLDADIAGINTITKLGPATVGVGYYRAYDQSFFSTSRTTRGIDDLDIVAVSADYNINKNAKVGAAYYLYADNRNNADNATVQTPMTLHVFGVNGDMKLGKLGLSGFAAMQQGVVHSKSSGRTTVSGYAFNAAAKLPIGPGTLRSAFLYASGDDGRDNINTSWQAVTQTQNGAISAPANTYNESNMMLLNRAAGMEGTQADVNIVNSINNRNQGVILATLGYDAQITPKCYLNANVGVAWAAKNNAGNFSDTSASSTSATTGDITTTRTVIANRPVNGSGGFNGTNFLGTEINLETGYKMYDNLTAKIQAAYVILGGYYAGTAVDGKDPEDPYTARVMLSYVF